MRFIIDSNNFLDHQKEWWNLNNFIKLLVGGYGCGKSYIAALRAIYLSYINSPHPGMLVSPTFPIAKKTLIPHLKDIMTRAGLKWHHNKTDNEFYINNWEGKFWVASADNPDSLRGPNLAWAGLDEPFITKKDAFEQMLARIRVGDHRELFLTGTPESLNWGYDIAMNDDNRYDIGVVKGKTKNNPYLPESYYEMLTAAYNDEMVKAYLNGEFVNLNQGRVYEFDREVNTLHIDTHGWQIGAGIDFNVDYMSAVIFAYSSNHLHFFDEIRQANSNSFNLSSTLALKHPGINIYPDATGAARKSSSTKSDHSIFKEDGFRIKSGFTNPRVMDRVNAVNKGLRNKYITVEPGTCPYLVKDLERNVWVSGDIDKKSDPSLTHAGDAAGYAVYNLFPVLKREVLI